MDKILQEIDEAFAPQIQQAQDAVNSATFELSNLQMACEEKKKAVREYYEAVVQKERAEEIIANASVEVVASVSKASKLVK